MTWFPRINLVSGAFSLILRVTTLTANRELIFPAEAPLAGQALRASTGSPNQLEWFTPSAGGGGLTSVGLTMPAIFSVPNSPLTANGSLTVNLNNQNANLVFASPASGGAAAPTFRALVAADLPAHDASLITTGTVAFARLPVGNAANTIAAGNDTRFHNQNTDTGTTATSFIIDSSAGTNVRVKNGRRHPLAARNNADTAYADVICRNLIVQGTQTIINSNQVDIGDNIINLNSDYVGNTPTENAGFRVNRGTAPNGAYQIIFNESRGTAQAGFEGQELDLCRVRELNFTSANVTAGIVTLTHGLGRKPVLWKLYSSSDRVFTPDVRGVNNTQIELDLGTVTISGTWTLVVGG